VNRIRLRLPTLVLQLALLGLAACSGGAPTTQNPNTAVTTASVYAGPAPATADVEAFKVNLWQNINMASRCGGCHKAGGQSPMFARSDDVNQAYSAALTVVNLTQADQSTMVVKVGGGHNCWLSSPSACADILTTWIQNLAAPAGRPAQRRSRSPRRSTRPWDRPSSSQPTRRCFPARCIRC
jgi:cytochrome c553